jgi:hypothetical protein
VHSFVTILGESTDDNIVISVIENFISNRVRSEPEGDIGQIINEAA